MRLNKTKKLFVNNRRKAAKNSPQWVYKKTDRKWRNSAIKYSWRQQKLKV